MSQLLIKFFKELLTLRLKAISALHAVMHKLI
jgi:hypothetical protein